MDSNLYIDRAENELKLAGIIIVISEIKFHKHFEMFVKNIGEDNSSNGI